MVLLLVLDLAVRLASLEAAGSESLRAVVEVIVDAFAYLAYFWIVLRLFRRERRFRQTAGALLGTEILLYLLSMPLLLWSRAIDAPDAQLTIPSLLYIVLFIWSIDIAGFILSKAIERPYILGVVIVVLYVMISMVISGDLSGSAGS